MKRLYRLLALTCMIGLALALPAAGFAQTNSAAIPSSCPIFPSNSIFNTPVDTLPVHSMSSTYIGTFTGQAFHADFGSGYYDGKVIGIPYNVVPGTQAKVAINFYPDAYVSDSDPGPFPIPGNALIESAKQDGSLPDSGDDRHVLVVDKDNKMLYELYKGQKNADGSWSCQSSAKWDLSSNALRPDGLTSTDAAGLPVLPLLIRYDEVAAAVAASDFSKGEAGIKTIGHVVRMCLNNIQSAHVWPARHNTNNHIGQTQYPPMGQRFRLKASFPIYKADGTSDFSPEVRVILKSFKKYGLMIADNAGPMFVEGVPDSRWNNDQLRFLQYATASDLEAVDTSSLMVDPNSGQVKGTASSLLPPTNLRIVQ